MIEVNELYVICAEVGPIRVDEPGRNNQILSPGSMCDVMQTYN